MTAEQRHRFGIGEMLLIALGRGRGAAAFALTGKNGLGQKHQPEVSALSLQLNYGASYRNAAPRAICSIVDLLVDDLAHFFKRGKPHRMLILLEILEVSRRFRLEVDF
jgi:hypothetical protein